ncbi:MAG: discoidin domain-containing protein [Betaproteobacteria bacterium]|nr:discoidin domain-containing protein [Betaproteobacteria bacterium]
MAVHRYWRWLCTACNSGAIVGLSEIQMLDSGFVDRFHATYGTVTGSSYYAPESLTVAKSCDDDITTEWASSGATTPSAGTPEWLKIDFGAVTQYDLSILTIRNRDGGTYATGQAPKDFKLQYSDDDSAWSDVFAITAQTGWTRYGEKRYFNASGTSEMSPPPPPSAAVGTTKRLWRVRPSAVDGGTVMSMAEMQMRILLGGADQCAGGTPYAGNFLEGAIADVFDDNATSYCGGGSPKDWFGYLFASSKDIIQITIAARETSNFNQTPKDFVVEYWDDGSWVTASTVTGSSGWTSGLVRTFTFGSDPVASGRPLVFVCT